jgi:hypothetical protein
MSDEPLNFKRGDLVCHISRTGATAIIVAIDGDKAWTRRGGMLDAIEPISDLVRHDDERKLNFLEWYASLSPDQRWHPDR